ncbi:hypothetical protein IKG49_03005 [Candidatus Saccharibacteria bacterium]|nr:hypothetical protein [Candidatus Saccharibacteria bacterium]
MNNLTSLRFAAANKTAEAQQRIAAEKSAAIAKEMAEMARFETYVAENKVMEAIKEAAIASIEKFVLRAAEAGKRSASLVERDHRSYSMMPPMMDVIDKAVECIAIGEYEHERYRKALCEKARTAISEELKAAGFTVAMKDFERLGGLLIDSVEW